MTGPVIAIIPSRYGSTRLPGKALADLAGVPLIVRTCRQVASAGRVDEILVATDDARIVEVVEAQGFSAVMTDPALPSGTDRVAAALGGRATRLVVNVQGDEPLIEPGTIDTLIALFDEPPLPDMATLAAPYPEGVRRDDPAAVKVVMDAQGMALYFSRAPIPFPRDGSGPAQPYLHLGIYAYRPEFLKQFVAWPPSPLELTERLEQLRALEYGARIRVGRVAKATPGIDTPEDLLRVRQLLAAGSVE